MAKTKTTYVSTGGEVIEVADYNRWIRQAKAAYHTLDENFTDGRGHAQHHDNQQAQLSDLLCQLRHLAQAMGLDFKAANRHAAANFKAERRPHPPCLKVPTHDH